MLLGVVDKFEMDFDKEQDFSIADPISNVSLMCKPQYESIHLIDIGHTLSAIFNELGEPPGRFALFEKQAIPIPW